MLGKVFARFVEKSPISVMVRGTLERVLGAEQLDAWFARTAQKQYTRTVLFSTVYDILRGVYPSWGRDGIAAEMRSPFGAIRHVLQKRSLPDAMPDGQHTSG